MRAKTLLLGLLITAASLGADPSLRLKVSPQESFAPANLFVRLDVAPNASNRMLSVVADSEGFYRSSQISIEGDRGPKIVDLRLKSLPSGYYEVRAILTDDRGREVASVQRDVVVIPSASER